MELKTLFAQDLYGNAIPNPLVYVYEPGTNILVAGLENSDGILLSNPFSGSATGQIQFAAPGGDYDMRVSSGIREYVIKVRFIDTTDAEIAETQSISATENAALVSEYKDNIFEIFETAQAIDDAVSEASLQAGLAATSANNALAIYGSTSAMQTARAAAANSADAAYRAARDASSAVQQDLSGINAAALHRSPNAVTAMFVYDTSKDSDGGAWTERCQHTSWYNEPINGKWLGAVAGANLAAAETAARAISGATTGDYFQASFDGKFYRLNSGSGTTEVFRGNKRDFPRLAGIVAESSNVTIYDLTEPGRPMWMRFAGQTWSPTPSSNIATVAAMNGTMLVGTAGTGGLGWILFPKDYEYFQINSTVRYYDRNIANRNINVFQAVDGGAVALANRTVNAVAMTVLPDAPVDPVTGLKVPTIAVATGGGLSIIKDDQRVFSISPPDYSSGTTDPVFIGDAIVWKSGGSSAQFIYRIVRNIRNINASTTSAESFSIKRKDIFAGLGRLIGFNGKRDFITESHGFNNAGPYVLCRVASNNANTVRSVQADITNIYNTGHMTGDIRRAYLADVDAGSVTGPELVTNGTFDANVTGWTTESNAGLMWNADGSATANATSGSRNVSQAINTIIGRSYRFSVRASGASSTRVRVGTAIAGAQFADITPTATPTVYERIFTATTTTTFITFFGAGDGVGAITIDDFSLREVVADRSYKARGASITGTLTKSQVASAAQLVAYSGFSAANYLREPYSADLDFGTGEWSVGAWVNLPTTPQLAVFPLVNTELLSNTTFDTATGWTLYGVTISGGKLIFNNATGQNPNAFAAINGAASFDAYEVTVTITDYVSGSLGLILYNSNGAISTSGSGLSNNGTFTIRLGGVGFSNGNFGIYCSNGTTLNVESVSVKRLGPAPIADRAHSSGARINLGVNAGGLLTATAFDGTTTRTVTTTASYNTGTWLKAEADYTTDGTLSISVNGVEVATTRGNPLGSLNSRYNLLTKTEQFDDAAWVKNQVTAQTTTATTDPLNGTSAEIITATASTNSHRVYQSVSTTTERVQISCRIALKKGTHRYATILSATDQGQGWLAATIDLDTGAITKTGVGTSSPAPILASATSTNLGNGWYEVSIVGTPTQNTANRTLLVYLASSANPVYGSTFAEDSWAASGTESIYIWGASLVPANQANLPYQRVNTATDFDFQAPLTIGNSYALDAPFPGSIALLKLSATLPTAEQSAWIYEQEKQMFREGAQICLPDSGSIVDLAYDEATDKWIAASAANESEWSGLVRTNVTPVPAGSYSRVTVGGGVQMLARTTTNPGVDITIPAYGLRDEFIKRSEASAKLNQQLAIFDYDGGFTATTVTGNTAITNVTGITYPTNYIGARVSGSGIPADTFVAAASGTTIYLTKPTTASASSVAISFTDFILPVGYTAVDIFSNGAQRREGAVKDFTRLYDGFKETIRFGVAPSTTTWIQITAVRSAQ